MEDVIGERLRGARLSRELSLNDVAGQAHISASTLSRIETGKQGLDLGLFLEIAGILHIDVGQVLDAARDEGATDPVVARLVSLTARDRVNVWRELAAASRAKASARSSAVRDLAAQVEELLAQIDYVRSEIESVRSRITRTR